jgi:hypothetical protein
VAPACFAFLIVPFALLEARQVFDASRPLPVGRLLGSAAAAFLLNCSVFLLVGRTSALTMNIAGVVKDWMLICASVGLFGRAPELRRECGPARAWQARKARLGTGSVCCACVPRAPADSGYCASHAAHHPARRSVVTRTQVVGYAVTDLVYMSVPLCRA